MINNKVCFIKSHEMQLITSKITRLFLMTECILSQNIRTLIWKNYSHYLKHVINLLYVVHEKFKTVANIINLTKFNIIDQKKNIQYHWKIKGSGKITLHGLSYHYGF